MQKDPAHIMHQLNDVQSQAVQAPLGPLLILAGAGSGKTRVLVRRIAYLVHVLGESSSAIMAVTFTNKASREMRGRIEKLLGYPFPTSWMGTFHGLSHRLLRIHWHDAKLRRSFEIMDSDDQLRLVRRIVRDAGLDEKKWQPKTVRAFINGHKEDGRRSTQLGHSADEKEQTFIALYRLYEQACKHQGVVDFAELLLRTVELLQNNQEVREKYQQRFRHILIDEFQDTNSIQYAWIKLLGARHRNVFAVGDDDQSIYGWRGARVENIQNFTEDFKGARTLRLERNYRSTSTILQAANAVIANNETRLGKTLWTEGEAGAPLRLYQAFNENDEAHFVAMCIQEYIADGHARAECAILYRTSAQSRTFEQKLLAAGLPYRVYGGLRFFERAEIKDALAYLRLMSSLDSDVGFERAVNQPPRGIGARSLELIRTTAKEQNTSLWQASLQLVQQSRPTRNISHSLATFHQLICGLCIETKDMELTDQVRLMLARSGLFALYQNQKEQSEVEQSRVENLQQLISATEEFVYEPSVAEENGATSDAKSPEASSEALAAFLAQATLESGDAQNPEREDCVQLMTLHAAKGLEFPLVFLCGMEDGLFPHQLCLDEPGRLEEERRLCYVGITRAMKALYMTHAFARRLHGNDMHMARSRFIDELPAECVMEIRADTFIRPVSGHFRRASLVTQNGRVNNTSKSVPGDVRVAGGGVTSNETFAIAGNELHVGMKVMHKKFGIGIVVDVVGGEEKTRVQVRFNNHGTRWLLATMAKLHVLTGD